MEAWWLTSCCRHCRVSTRECCIVLDISGIVNLATKLPWLSLLSTIRFTAWSSSREPGQVFILLQNVYQAFDRIAKRRKVFKVRKPGPKNPQEYHYHKPSSRLTAMHLYAGQVETIGDCVSILLNQLVLRSFVRCPGNLSNPPYACCELNCPCHAVHGSHRSTRATGYACPEYGSICL
jgi:hypothetical protein